MNEKAQQAIRDVYADFAKECPALFEHSFVAGGAIRDIVLGKEVRDIDIFIPYSSDVFVAKRNQEFVKYINKFATYAGHDEYTLSNYSVYNLDKDYGLPTQLIFDSQCETPQEVLRRFPVSLSRIAFMPMENKVKKTNRFNASVANKVIYHAKPNDEADREYIRKVWRKFPEYTHKEIKGSL